jgi:glycosyltransferase involved in cell wall biosynthesis
MSTLARAPATGTGPRADSMSSTFRADDYPGRPRLLFIGHGESSHTHSWIDLLDGAQFNVRLFALPGGMLPPDDWRVRTYVPHYGAPALDPATRERLYPAGRLGRFFKRKVARARGAASVEKFAALWLAGVVKSWRPHVVHTLGLDPAGEFYFEVRRRHGLEDVGKWVLQTRGGSDLQLAHLDPVRSGEIAPVLRACDQLVSDNAENFRIARALGVREEQLSRIGTVPGTGGIDVEALAARWRGKTSERRVILWPKVYEVAWSKALPVYEALKLCWARIQPCEIHMLAMTAEARMYFWTLPEEIRRACRVSDRVPRPEALEAMTRARVMLAPSLVDGTPNSMFEAMAAGALPVVSPLETIRAVVEEERNVLFARNLYPEEIAAALVRAMTGDALVDAAAERNLALVRRVADRSEVRARVLGFYERLAAGG